ncbi:type II toxin-antitoxin system RelE/ParE family toxin [Epilithonimonas sp. UC225_85]|uniref:type II toxin-antitoxin system RelE/ParE family toxin n=1 Tax=Epilithonimonas sp. UC225_85 TaxID=3350167 RepID=UPI0036D3DF93
MEIRFSKASYDDLDEIEDYLLNEWNDKVLDDFNLRLEHCLKLITDGIAVFQKYEDTNYHKLLITKHNTLIYSLEQNILTVHRVLQNFQDPDDNQKSLKS